MYYQARLRKITSSKKSILYISDPKSSLESAQQIGRIMLKKYQEQNPGRSDVYFDVLMAKDLKTAHKETNTIASDLPEVSKVTRRIRKR